MKVSSCPEDTIITYSLGSCIGVTFYDPAVRVGGMAHCMLPLSRQDLEKARKQPCLYVDTGVTALLQAVLRKGASKRRLVVKVAGAARMFDGQDHFRTHKRNYTILRKILWKNNLLINAERVGGRVPRTMVLELATGNCMTVTKRIQTRL